MAKKKTTKKKSGSKKSKPKVRYSDYIFDKDEIVENKIFPVDVIKNKYAFGLKLPRNKDTFDNKGNVTGKTQIRFPVLITSDKVHRFIEFIPKEMHEKWKINFSQIPCDLPLRWSLKSIKKYLDGKEEEINSKELLEEIKNKYKKFLFFQKEDWYTVHALWDIGTYFFMLFSVFPLFELRSGKEGTGKTKVMKLSQRFTLNPTKILTNPTESVLFRKTNDLRPTTYVDEAEKLFYLNDGNVESDSRAEVINSGYSKGAVVPRVEKIGGRFETINYSVYSPKMIGSIRGLFGATESRAITHVMTRPPKKDKRGNIEVEDFDKNENWQEIRDKLYLFALQNWDEISKIYNNFNINSNLKNRDLQIWKPILTLSQHISGEETKNLIKFAEKISNQRAEDSIPEGNTDFKIFDIVSDLLNLGKDKNEIITLRPKEIRENYENTYGSDYCPKEKTITTKLDNYGFKDFRQPKDRYGAKYELSFIDFKNMIEPFAPSLFTDDSEESDNENTNIHHNHHNHHSSEDNNKNNVINGDESPENVTNNSLFSNKKCDENDENDECDENSTGDKVKTENIPEKEKEEIMKDFS